VTNRLVTHPVPSRPKKGKGKARGAPFDPGGPPGAPLAEAGGYRLEVVEALCVLCGNKGTSELPVLWFQTPNNTVEEQYSAHADVDFFVSLSGDKADKAIVNSLFAQLGVEPAECPPPNPNMGLCGNCFRPRKKSRAPCSGCGSDSTAIESF
jgi:hypothetical protein